ncbi:hypothetical protein BH11ACT4_BH11ACT4_05710 [soil metagenome]
MRVELWKRPVSYAAVGATQASDLLTYPPRGFRPIERRARIGHGDERFDYAKLAVLTWGVQRNSGFTVKVADAPAAVSEMTYTPVAFDDDGQPVQSAQTGLGTEATFGPDGTAVVAPGDTAVMGIPFGFIRVRAPVRVVYVVDEPKRTGFAYGTLKGHPEAGEEGWVVEQKDDGSVWMVVRAFSRPSNAFWWLVYPVLRMSQEYYTRRYLRALSGPIE